MFFQILLFRKDNNDKSELHKQEIGEIRILDAQRCSALFTCIFAEVKGCEI